jgi:hypothetical protein
MSPTIFRELGFRFFFFSREEPRIQVHSTALTARQSFGLNLRSNWQTITAYAGPIFKQLGD